MDNYNSITGFSFFLLVSILLCTAAFGQDVRSKQYPDGHSDKVLFPMGDISFADSVVAFRKGSPSANEAHSNPQKAIGVPDYDSNKDDNYLTLGCGGSVVLQFSDNTLVDVPGPDLYVFEIGPDIEPTVLSISKDGSHWILVGKIEGGKAAVDISDFVDPGEVFRFVRLSDLRSSCGGEYPGADIDAVGAIGSGVKYTLNSAVLFQTDKYDLKPAAHNELNKLIRNIGTISGLEILIEGHSDNVGSNASNQMLSEKRADAVKDYLITTGKIPASAIQTKGYGETQPIAGNGTAQGRQQNRRVEIVVVKQTNTNSNARPKKQILGLWTTNEGVLELTQTGNHISGEYTTDHGELVGELVGTNKLVGYWIEDRSDTKCSVPRNGRYYWGRAEIEFSKDMKSVKGKWGYCKQQPTKSTWNGTSLVE